MPYYRRAGGEETPDIHPGTGLLPECLFYFSMLSQFKHPQVRSDFLNGEFGSLKWAHDVSLTELDFLSSLFMPTWFGHSDISMREDFEHRALMLTKLVEARSESLLLGRDHSIVVRSYKEWRKILHELAFNSYWSKVGHCGKQLGESVPAPVKFSSVHTNTEPVYTHDVGVEVFLTSTFDASTFTESDVVEPEVLSCSAAFNSGLAVTMDENNNQGPVIFQSELSNTDNKLNSRGRDTRFSDISTLVTVKQSSSVAKPACSWCYKYGHQEENCWRKKGLCLICGSHHRMKDCPRFIPRTPLARPTCSSCGGDHLGKDCRRRKRVQVHCHWCGRHGHTEETCRVKSGACLICGSHNHVLPHCPSFISKSTLPVFPPW